MADASKDNYNFQKIIVVLGVSLLLVKFFAYYLTGSVAIFTDAMESIVNVVAGFIGLYALYLSAQPPDKSHPYGHGKVETISATVEGSMIAVAGVIIVYEAILNLLHPGEIKDLDIGLVLVALAAVANFVVGRAAIIKGRKNRSIALESSGKHLCTDTYSSFGIIIGLVVVYVTMSLGYDYKWLDPGIALLFGAFIIITGARVIRKAFDEIMDKADVEILDQVICCLNDHRSEDWIDIHNLRTIKYGSKLHIDMHITLPFDMTIQEEEDQKYKLFMSIYEKFGDSVDIVMMPEPCRGFSCIHCSRNCSSRKAPFSAHVEWNKETLVQGKPHALGHRVVIEDYRLEK